MPFLPLFNAQTNIQIARKVAYETLGEAKDAIRNHIRDYPEVDGVVVGDETRLRQIITNLARYVIDPSNSPIYTFSSLAMLASSPPKVAS